MCQSISFFQYKLLLLIKMRVSQWYKRLKTIFINVVSIPMGGILRTIKSIKKKKKKTRAKQNKSYPEAENQEKKNKKICKIQLR